MQTPKDKYDSDAIEAQEKLLHAFRVYREDLEKAAREAVENGISNDDLMAVQSVAQRSCRNV